MAKALDLQTPPSGNRVAIVTAQAGAGITIADKCRELGLSLAEFSPTTRKRLRRLIPPLNAVDNPVDIAWKADIFEASRRILATILDDDGVDAAIVAAVYYASNMRLMRAVIDTARDTTKPISVCLDSPIGSAAEVIDTLEASHIPTYPLPERAATGLAGLVRYGEILRAGK